VREGPLNGELAYLASGLVNEEDLGEAVIDANDLAESIL